MTLKALVSTKIVRLPEVRGEDWPLPEGTIHLPQGVRTHGSPGTPDVFDLEDRLVVPHEWDDSPQQRGKRYAALERAIARHEGIARVEAEDGADSGESTNSGEGEV